MDHLIPQGRISDQNVEPSVDVPMPEMLKETVESSQLVPLGCCHQRVVRQREALFVPPTEDIQDEIAGRNHIFWKVCA